MSLLLLNKFNPKKISDLQLWLDASQLGLADGDSVSSWTDLSNKNRHATQATAAKKPVFKTNIQNGNPVVRFDGTDDWMSTAAWGDLLQPNTIFIVAKIPIAASKIILDGVDSTKRHQFSTGITENTLIQFAGTSATITQLGIRGNWAIASLAYNSPLSNAYINGVLTNTGNLSTNVLSGLTLGGHPTIDDYHPSTDMGEIIVYNKILTVTERQRIELYLSRKWGVSLA